MTIATPSPHVKIRANSDGYDNITNTSIFNNIHQEFELDNQYPLVLKRAASSEAKLPSYIDNGCDDDYIDIDLVDDTDTLSISSSDDSFTGSECYSNNNNTQQQQHVVNSSFDSFIRTDLDGIAYNSDMSSQQPQQRLATVESGIALSDLDLAEKKKKKTSMATTSSPKMGKSRPDIGCRSSMAFLPPLHPSSSSVSNNSHGVLLSPSSLSQSNDSTTTVAEQQRTHRANSISSSSYYSLDAGKHGFLTHHTPADSVDSLVFQYPTSEVGGGEVEEEEEEEEETNTPPIPMAHGTSVEMNGWELSPRCILPYQERKRLMELEEEVVRNGGRVTESESGVSDEGGGGSPTKDDETNSMYGREESDAIDYDAPEKDETATTATAVPGQATSNTNNEGNNDQSPPPTPPPAGLSSPKASFTRLFAKVTKEAKKSRGKISRMRRFCMGWMMKKN